MSRYCSFRGFQFMHIQGNAFVTLGLHQIGVFVSFEPFIVPALIASIVVLPLLDCYVGLYEHYTEYTTAI